MIINIKNLKAETVVGIHDWEKTSKRPIVLNVRVVLASEKSCVSDVIEDTLNYETLAEELIEFAESSRFGLIETLAGKLVELILAKPIVQEVELELDKLGAIPTAESVSVLIKANSAK